jgi:replicative DNA helicase
MFMGRYTATVREEDLPANYEAEEAVLGGILIDSGMMVDVAAILKGPENFGREKNGQVYQAMLNLDMRDASIDFVTVVNELDNMGKLEEAGGPAYITELLTAVPTSVNTVHYANIVHEKSIQRSLVQAGISIVQMAYKGDPGGAEALIAAVEQEVARVGQKLRPRMVTVDELMSGIWDDLFNPRSIAMQRIFTGLPGIDGPLLGIESGRFWAMAATPGSGKTSLALNIVRGVAKHNKGKVAVLYFHPEQPKEEITHLLWCLGTENIPPIRLKAMMTSKEQREEYVKAASFVDMSTQTTTGRRTAAAQAKVEYLVKDPQPAEIEALTQSQAELDGVPIILNDPSGQNIFQILATIRRVRTKLPDNVFLLVVFDGAHLIPGMGEGTRTQELYTITRNLKIAAQKVVTADGTAPGALLANTQLNRQIFNDVANRVYLMKHLRDSGSWEADADIILFIDRESVFKNDNGYNGNGNGKRIEWDPFWTVYAKNRQTSQVGFKSHYVMHTSTMKVKGRDLV